MATVGVTVSDTSSTNHKAGLCARARQHLFRTLSPWSLPWLSMYSNFCSLVNTFALDLSSGTIFCGPFLAMYSSRSKDLYTCRQ